MVLLTRYSSLEASGDILNVQWGTTTTTATAETSTDSNKTEENSNFQSFENLPDLVITTSKKVHVLKVPIPESQNLESERGKSLLKLTELFGHDGHRCQRYKNS